ncbi:MAG: hypothetical protein HY958_04205 [Bacteroidia bacterium]|nr:hypothetical protein [Bacteroidia bacterium]
MELTVNLGFEQIIGLVRQLPANQIVKLKAELDDKYIIAKSETEITEFQEFLLRGPVMTDEQYNDFKQHRKRVNLWRQE